MSCFDINVLLNGSTLQSLLCVIHILSDNKKPSDNEFKSSGFMLAVNLAILSNS